MKLINPLLYQRVCQENTYLINKLTIPIKAEDVIEEGEGTDEDKESTMF